MLVAILLALVGLAGAAYQYVGTRLDARRSPEPGTLIDVDGRRFQIHCTGNGSPAVILESGLGDLLVEWKLVQPEIAKFTRVCAYDRAGYGGSDAGPMPRTSSRIAVELHTLLERAGEKQPFVLVGHSFGGYAVRVFSAAHSQDVAGLVLVDSTQEDQYELLPSAWNRIGDEQVKRYTSQARWAPFFIDLGIARLMLRSRGLNGNAYLILQTKYLRARASEVESVRTSAEEARAAGTIGDKPLIVLTGAKLDDVLRGGLSQQDFEEFRRVWVEDLQPRLVRLSPQGKHVILQDSGHDIPSERPDAIVDAVREIWAQTQPR